MITKKIISNTNKDIEMTESTPYLKPEIIEIATGLYKNLSQQEKDSLELSDINLENLLQIDPPRRKRETTISDALDAFYFFLGVLRTNVPFQVKWLDIDVEQDESKKLSPEDFQKFKEEVKSIHEKQANASIIDILEILHAKGQEKPDSILDPNKYETFYSNPYSKIIEASCGVVFHPFDTEFLATEPKDEEKTQKFRSLLTWMSQALITVTAQYTLSKEKSSSEAFISTALSGKDLPCFQARLNKICQFNEERFKFDLDDMRTTLIGVRAHAGAGGADPMCIDLSKEEKIANISLAHQQWETMIPNQYAILHADEFRFETSSQCPDAHRAKLINWLNAQIQEPITWNGKVYTSVGLLFCDTTFMRDYQSSSLHNLSDFKKAVMASLNITDPSKNDMEKEWLHALNTFLYQLIIEQNEEHLKTSILHLRVLNNGFFKESKQLQKGKFVSTSPCCQTELTGPIPITLWSSVPLMRWHKKVGVIISPNAQFILHSNENGETNRFLNSVPGFVTRIKETLTQSTLSTVVQEHAESFKSKENLTFDVQSTRDYFVQHYTQSGQQHPITEAMLRPALHHYTGATFTHAENLPQAIETFKSITHYSQIPVPLYFIDPMTENPVLVKQDDYKKLNSFLTSIDTKLSIEKNMDPPLTGSLSKYKLHFILEALSNNYNADDFLLLCKNFSHTEFYKTLQKDEKIYLVDTILKTLLTKKERVSPKHYESFIEILNNGLTKHLPSALFTVQKCLQLPEELNKLKQSVLSDTKWLTLLFETCSNCPFPSLALTISGIATQLLYCKAVEVETLYKLPIVCKELAKVYTQPNSTLDKLKKKCTSNPELKKQWMEKVLPEAHDENLQKIKNIEIPLSEEDLNTLADFVETHSVYIPYLFDRFFMYLFEMIDTHPTARHIFQKSLEKKSSTIYESFFENLSRLYQTELDKTVIKQFMSIFEPNNPNQLLALTWLHQSKNDYSQKALLSRIHKLWTKELLFSQDPTNLIVIKEFIEIAKKHDNTDRLINCTIKILKENLTGIPLDILQEIIIKLDSRHHIRAVIIQMSKSDQLMSLFNTCLLHPTISTYAPLMHIVFEGLNKEDQTAIAKRLVSYEAFTSYCLKEQTPETTFFRSLPEFKALSPYTYIRELTQHVPGSDMFQRELLPLLTTSHKEKDKELMAYFKTLDYNAKHVVLNILIMTRCHIICLYTSLPLSLDNTIDLIHSLEGIKGCEIFHLLYSLHKNTGTPIEPTLFDSSFQLDYDFVMNPEQETTRYIDEIIPEEEKNQVKTFITDNLHRLNTSIKGQSTCTYQELKLEAAFVIPLALKRPEHPLAQTYIQTFLKHLIANKGTLKQVLKDVPEAVLFIFYYFKELTPCLKRANYQTFLNEQVTAENIPFHVGVKIIKESPKFLEQLSPDFFKSDFAQTSNQLSFDFIIKLFSSTNINQLRHSLKELGTVDFFRLFMTSIRNALHSSSKLLSENNTALAQIVDKLATLAENDPTDFLFQNLSQVINDNTYNDGYYPLVFLLQNDRLANKLVKYLPQSDHLRLLLYLENHPSEFANFFSEANDQTCQAYLKFKSSKKVLQNLPLTVQMSDKLKEKIKRLVPTLEFQKPPVTLPPKSFSRHNHFPPISFNWALKSVLKMDKVKISGLRLNKLFWVKLGEQPIQKDDTAGDFSTLMQKYAEDPEFWENIIPSNYWLINSQVFILQLIQSTEDLTPLKQDIISLQQNIKVYLESHPQFDPNTKFKLNALLYTLNKKLNVDQNELQVDSLEWLFSETDIPNHPAIELTFKELRKTMDSQQRLANKIGSRIDELKHALDQELAAVPIDLINAEDQRSTIQKKYYTRILRFITSKPGFAFLGKDVYSVFATFPDLFSFMVSENNTFLNNFLLNVSENQEILAHLISTGVLGNLTPLFEINENDNHKFTDNFLTFLEKVRVIRPDLLYGHLEPKMFEGTLESTLRLGLLFMYLIQYPQAISTYLPKIPLRFNYISKTSISILQDLIKTLCLKNPSLTMENFCISEGKNRFIEKLRVKNSSIALANSVFITLFMMIPSLQQQCVEQFEQLENSAQLLSEFTNTSNPSDLYLGYMAAYLKYCSDTNFNIVTRKRNFYDNHLSKIVDIRARKEAMGSRKRKG